MNNKLLRAVVDTNVMIAAHSGSVESPNAQLRNRWTDSEFILLYSLDILTEYIEKLLEKNVSRDSIRELLLDIQAMGEFVTVERFHERKYPEDEDDIAFILCATNGNATHLVTYDRHLLDIADAYEFVICRPKTFLSSLG